MKFSIFINQRAVVENGLNLDVIDLAIFDFIKDFTHSEGSCKVLYQNGKPYYWISYKLVISEMPMLRIGSKDAIYRRIKKLINEEVLVAHPDNQHLQQTYFGFGRMYERLVFKTEPTDETLNNVQYSEHTPSAQTLDNKKIKNSKLSISIKNAFSFYKRQIELNEENEESLLEKYILLVGYLFGENAIGCPVDHILKLQNQLTFDEYKNLFKAAHSKNLSISELLDSWVNSPKYSKGKVSIYLTLNNWINRSDGKNLKPRTEKRWGETVKTGETLSLLEIINKMSNKKKGK